MGLEIMANDYMVSDLTWDQLYDEVLKGNVSRDEFLDYLVMTSKESYNDGLRDGLYDTTIKDGE